MQYCKRKSGLKMCVLTSGNGEFRTENYTSEAWHSATGTISAEGRTVVSSVGLGAEYSVGLGAGNSVALPASLAGWAAEDICVLERAALTPDRRPEWSGSLEGLSYRQLSR